MDSTMIDLSGEWRLGTPEWGEKTIPATLPGDNYTALLSAGMIPDPHFGRNENLVQEFRRFEWIFSRDFELPAGLLECRYVYLNCEMVDTFATIRINGRRCQNDSHAHFCKASYSLSSHITSTARFSAVKTGETYHFQ